MNFRILIFLALTIACGLTCSQRSKNEKPNFLFIFADDQTFQSIRALGNEEILTPNLDQLVSSGTVFSQTFNMGGWNGAICVASRSMINSGRFIWNAKQETEFWENNDTSSINRTWAKLMEKGGYNTYMTGKWHVNLPPDSSFQIVGNKRPGMPHSPMYKNGITWEEAQEMVANGESLDGSFSLAYNRPLSRTDTSWQPWDRSFGGFWEGGKHWSEVVADEAISKINDEQFTQDPFFMYIAFNAPHDPRQSPKEYVDKYPVDQVRVPENFLPEYPYKDGMGCSVTLRDEALAPFPRTEYAVQKHRQEYYAIITHLDAQIGRILESLEASGKRDNIYIVFTADHGLAVGHHGLIGKQNMYDHSIRVPMIVVGPNVPKSEKRNQEIYVQDVMPTFLDYANIEIPEHVDFKSFRPIIENPQSENNYSAIYGCYINLQRMIRKDGMKLIVYPKINKILLYDLEKDPLEMNNLAPDQKYSETVNKLFQELKELQKSMNDKIDIGEISSYS